MNTIDIEFLTNILAILAPIVSIALVWVQTRLSKAIKNLDISDEKSALLMNTIEELYNEVKRKYGEGNEERFQRMERAIEDIRRNWGDVEGNTEMLKARADDLIAEFKDIQGGQ